MNRLRGIWSPGIRMQLMFWYTGIFALLLLTFSIIFYLALEDALQSDVDADLQLRIQQIAVGITNDNGTTSIEEVLEDVPKLDPAMIGDSFTSVSNQESQVRTGANANFRSCVRILDAKGKTIYATPASQFIPTPSASVTEALHGAVWKGTITIPNGQTMRLYSARLMYKGTLFGIIQVGESLAYLNAILHNIVVKLLLIAPFMLLCGAIGSYWLARRAFVPIRNLTCIAEDISAGDLDRRISVPRPRDEVQHLALTFNQMIGRLNLAFLQQRRFVADASHELRTPVAAIRSMTDVALAQSNTLEECTSVLQDVNIEAERLGWLIQNLLMLARSDEGQVQLDHEFVRLDLLVCDVVATLETLAVEREITLQIERLDPITVRGDTSRLIQCVMNLLDNALTYTDAGGKVTIHSEVKEIWGCIAIKDTGIGIAPENLPHIFERFYRTDPARSQIRGGSGLGLSIVDWIVRTHGGSMRVESQPGYGSTFTMILPLADSLNG